VSINQADYQYIPEFLTQTEAEQLFNELQSSIDWRQDQVTVYGKKHPIPRLQAFIADLGVSYTYSGFKLTGSGFPHYIETLKERIAAQTQTRFNALLANLYRDGKDHMGWHSDDERELGAKPVIASLSLGAERTFQLRNRRTPKQRIDIELASGSLLIMGPELQHQWQHALPKRLRVSQPRINLTFRYIYN
jgi:alkylated DNA repair dioxygenase AlkB